MKEKFIFHNILALVFSTIILCAAPAKAEDGEPLVRGIMLYEVGNDFAFDAENSDDEISETTGKAESFLIVPITDRLALEASLLLTSISRPNDGTDRTFQDHGVFFEELRLSYFGDDFTLIAGKYNPTFGAAWDLAGGIVGGDLADDYELSERLGFSGSYFWDDPFGGLQVLTANAFFVDTTFLSGSFTGNREKTNLEDGGVSNTENLGSYSLTMDGEDSFGMPGLTTHLSYSYQDAGDANINGADENGYALGAGSHSAPMTMSTQRFSGNGPAFIMRAAMQTLIVIM